MAGFLEKTLESISCYPTLIGLHIKITLTYIHTFSQIIYGHIMKRWTNQILWAVSISVFSDPPAGSFIAPIQVGTRLTQFFISLHLTRAASSLHFSHSDSRQSWRR